MIKSTNENYYRLIFNIRQSFHFWYAKSGDIENVVPPWGGGEGILLVLCAKLPEGHHAPSARFIDIQCAKP
jgi:hypothetical protein